MLPMNVSSYNLESRWLVKLEISGGTICLPVQL